MDRKCHNKLTIEISPRRKESGMGTLLNMDLTAILYFCFWKQISARNGGTWLSFKYLKGRDKRVKTLRPTSPIYTLSLRASELHEVLSQETKKGRKEAVTEAETTKEKIVFFIKRHYQKMRRRATGCKKFLGSYPFHKDSTCKISENKIPHETLRSRQQKR